ncbi:MAG: hypothetical protein ACKVYV_01940, partial [Limisphaerales bacterium]
MATQSRKIRAINLTPAQQAEMFHDSWKPEPWAFQADTLLRAAEHLFTEHWNASYCGDSGPEHPDRLGFNEPAMLLLALALENALKGSLIKKGLVTAETAREKWKGLRGHTIHELARDLGIKLSTADQRLYRHLSRYSIWAGKYPAA